MNHVKNDQKILDYIKSMGGKTDCSLITMQALLETSQSYAHTRMRHLIQAGKIQRVGRSIYQISNGITNADPKWVGMRSANKADTIHDWSHAASRAAMRRILDSGRYKMPINTHTMAILEGNKL